MLGTAIPAVQHFPILGLEPDFIDAFPREAVVLGLPTDERLAGGAEELVVTEDAPGQIERDDSEPSNEQRRRRGLCKFGEGFRPTQSRAHDYTT